jgi:GMP synthase (glutamine-hydrolysing)
MKIGILQTGPVAPELAQKHGNYPDMFEALLAPHGFTFQTWRVLDGVFPESPDDADGWLITGSRYGVYEDHDFLRPLEELIRTIVAAGRPLVGVCFGHQIIAQALGGHVEKFSGGWSIGPTTYRFPDGEKVIQAWHQDQVITPPEGAQTVASSDFCRHAALLIPGKVFTVQPHPEFGDGFIQSLIDTRGDVVPKDTLDAAKARMGTKLDSFDIGASFARFFREGTPGWQAKETEVAS